MRIINSLTILEKLKVNLDEHLERNIVPSFLIQTFTQILKYSKYMKPPENYKYFSDFGTKCVLGLLWHRSCAFVAPTQKVAFFYTSPPKL